MISLIKKRFSDCYLNTFLPCDSALIKSIKEHVGCESEIAVRNDDFMVIFLGSDTSTPIKAKLIFDIGVNNLLCVNKIEFE